MVEPQSKRQKLSGDEKPKAAEIMAFGEPMYDEATAHKMLKEVVLASAEDAMDGEAVIGFDPDDAALDNVYEVNDDLFRQYITPMIYSARMGDIKMCRYLASRGASTTKLVARWPPMHFAAQQGHLEVCKFLQANGANLDIWKKDFFFTLLCITSCSKFFISTYPASNYYTLYIMFSGSS